METPTLAQLFPTAQLAPQGDRNAVSKSILLGGGAVIFASIAYALWKSVQG